MRILLTGATGFIGTAVATHLQDQGLEVISVGGPRSRSAAETDDFFVCDVSDSTEVEKLISVGKVDAVVHAAGLAHRSRGGDDRDFGKVNVDGVRNITELAAKLNAKHVVLLSSVLVYGKAASRSSAEIAEDISCLPKDIYGESKLKGEQACRQVCDKAGLSLTILRLVPTVGEGSKGNFAKLVRAIYRGTFVWVGTGKNRKSMIYVGDVARAVETVLTKKKPGLEMFNISAPAASMKEIVNAIARTLDRRFFPVTIPANPIAMPLRIASGLPFISGISDTIEKWLSDEVYSSKKIEEAYGFKTETSVVEAVCLDAVFYLKNAGSKQNK